MRKAQSTRFAVTNDKPSLQIGQLDEDNDSNASQVSTPTSNISIQDFIKQNQENPLVVLAEAIKQQKKEAQKAGNIVNQESTKKADHELTALELKLSKAFKKQLAPLSLRERLAKSMKKKLLQTAIEMDAEAARTMEMRCENDLFMVRSNT